MRLRIQQVLLLRPIATTAKLRSKIRCQRQPEGTRGADIEARVERDHRPVVGIEHVLDVEADGYRLAGGTLHVVERVARADVEAYPVGDAEPGRRQPDILRAGVDDPP